MGSKYAFYCQNLVFVSLCLDFKFILFKKLTYQEVVADETVFMAYTSVFLKYIFFVYIFCSTENVSVFLLSTLPKILLNTLALSLPTISFRLDFLQRLLVRSLSLGQRSTGGFVKLDHNIQLLLGGKTF